ncbi:unnamed protein product [Oppiella nova]|uniref:Uncharacterized protein n=1 Tax=Oppiella nova TaxID=334625 RepID=A0A7R9M543_9ACAR|nr:unnamed protein product [Oppiella nova]CAG2169644.1 unnamed protein product [Oppiella nova]
MELEGKVALITGSASGIGKEIALKLSALGADVVITDINRDGIQEVVQKCRSLYKHKALGVYADITSESDVKNLVDKTVEEYERIDILVNCAGIVFQSDFYDPEYIKLFDKVMNINVRSIQVLTQLVVPYLESTKGNIVNISSVCAVVPVPTEMAYCMSKSAINMFTKCLARQLGPKGVRVNSVNPGTVRSPLLGERAEYMVKACHDNYPLQRIGETVDIAESVAFLVSDKASFITGINMPVDGSASGIGKEIALKLSSLGADVVITDINRDGIQEVVQKCRSLHKHKALGVYADITSESDVKNLVDKTVEEYERIDILVNCAGICPKSYFHDPDYVEIPMTMAYCMSKSAINMFTKCLAMHLGPKGVRVNSINPGSVLTPLLGEKAQYMVKACENNYPLRRIGETVDIAESVAFLVSDKASFITGINMPVDGGAALIMRLY